MLSMYKPEVEEAERILYKWDESPHEALRMRAAFIRTKALCPVSKKPVDYVCPKSGIPTHHDQESWENDKNYHENKIYEKLKKVNLYEHDIRSGRKFDEFIFPGQQNSDYTTNLTNWDTFFYTRDFTPMNTEYNLAAATKVLTYPITIAAILYKFSPYSPQPKGTVTYEGMKSLAALKYSLYPPYTKSSGDAANYKDRAIRIFIVGARTESLLPGYVWKQFGYLFPNSRFEFHLIGPESYFDRETRTFGPTNTPHGRAKIDIIDDQISLHYHSKYFHEVYDQGDLFPFDPYLDIFFLFHPGFQTQDKIYWDKCLKGLLESKCPIFVSGYHEEDINRELAYLKHHELNEEMDVLMTPTVNEFACTKIELVDINPTETLNANSKIFAFRGKRYHAIKTDTPAESEEKL